MVHPRPGDPHLRARARALHDGPAHRGAGADVLARLRPEAAQVSPRRHRVLRQPDPARRLREDGRREPRGFPHGRVGRVHVEEQVAAVPGPGDGAGDEHRARAARGGRHFLLQRRLRRSLPSGAGCHRQRRIGLGGREGGPAPRGSHHGCPGGAGRQLGGIRLRNRHPCQPFDQAHADPRWQDDRDGDSAGRAREVRGGRHRRQADNPVADRRRAAVTAGPGGRPSHRRRDSRRRRTKAGSHVDRPRRPGSGVGRYRRHPRQRREADDVSDPARRSGAGHCGHPSRGRHRRSKSRAKADDRRADPFPRSPRRSSRVCSAPSS